MKHKLPAYLSSLHKSHIIFDFDETLGTLNIDWQGWYEHMTKFLRQFEPTFDRSQVSSWAVGQNQVVAKHGKRVRDKIVAFNDTYEDQYVKGVVDHELLDLIPTLSMYSKSLWTSNSRSTILKQLDRFQMRSYFHPIVAREEVVFLKPHHEGFAQIHAIHQLPLDKYLFIGDSQADQLAAQTVGIDFLHVSEIDL